MKRTLASIATLLCLLTMYIIWVYLGVPSPNKEWDDMLEFQTTIDYKNGEYVFSHLRDYSLETEQVAWREASYPSDHLSRMWLYLTPLDFYGPVGHSWVVFEFTDPEKNESRYLSLSVEARREQGEEYSVLGGILNRFELMYVWSTERDVFSYTHAIRPSREVYRFELALDQPTLQAIFQSMVDRSNDLAHNLRFYHTLRHNCTNELVYAVRSLNLNETLARFHYSYLLTGIGPRYLYGLGVIHNPHHLPWKELRAQSEIQSDIANALQNHYQTFSPSIR